MKRSARGLNVMADIMLDLTGILGFEQGRKVVQNGFILPSGWQAEAVHPGRSGRNRSKDCSWIGLANQAAILEVNEKALLSEISPSEDGARNLSNPKPVQRRLSGTKRNRKLTAAVSRDDGAVSRDEVAGTIVGTVRTGGGEDGLIGT